MRNKSFTLIELLVVIAVIGLLASIVIVNLTGTRSKANIARGLQFSQSIHHALGAYAVGVWSFDEGSGTIANDSSGYNNHGTLTNGPVWRCASTDPNYTPSGQGCSIQFDGVDDYVEVPDSASLDVTDGATFQAWVYPRDFIFHRSVYEKNLAYMLYIGTGVEIAGQKSFRPHVYAGGSWRYGSINYPGVENQWYHVVYTYLASTGAFKAYINGSEYSIVWSIPPVAGQTINPSTTALKIAGTVRGASTFNGFIDEVRIYEKALGTAQIKELYYAGLDRLLVKGLIDEQEYQKRLALKD